MTDYEFIPLMAADLPLMKRWLAAPHLRQWWGEPAHQFELIKTDLDDADIDMRLVLFEQTPIGYIQDYDPRDWPDIHFAGLPAGTRATDQFIGEHEMLEKGHGSAFLRARAEALIEAGATMVVTDPDAANMRACAAYRKAGFHEQSRFNNKDSVTYEGANKEGTFLLMIYRG